MTINAVNRNRDERRKSSISKADAAFDLRYKFDMMAKSHLKYEAKAQRRGQM